MNETFCTHPLQCMMMPTPFFRYLRQKDSPPGLFGGSNFENPPPSVSIGFSRPSISIQGKLFFFEPADVGPTQGLYFRHPYACIPGR